MAELLAPTAATGKLPLAELLAPTAAGRYVGRLVAIACHQFRHDAYSPPERKSLLGKTQGWLFEKSLNFPSPSKTEDYDENAAF